MKPVDPPLSGDARTRAGRTKRDRTRRALLDAAEAAFHARGWGRTRVEDVAVAAGVSSATAYNHFPSKHVLIGEVFAPYVFTQRQQADQDVAAGRPMVEALEDQVRALARMSHRHRPLLAAFTSAVFDYMSAVGRRPEPGDDRDPRNLVPLPDALSGLIVRGQATGELRGYPPAQEIAISVINLLILRCVNCPDESAETTAELLLTVLFGGLRPELLAGGVDGRPFARPTRRPAPD